ncbi:hypothetical protein COY27_00100 [Candidatus Woesearchaeota archaeon CG_4_10_14_0_2_um_filter_33_13]|nr:MAG: hypothetical protein COY27_00100 [Candidatus Woesearchaeota archaeon CG_4_10_14_0_2_um_filter_33_13]
MPEKVAEKVEAYCVKCKAKRIMSEPKEVSMEGKGGVKRRAMKGKCPKCTTTMFRIMGAKK